MSRTPSSSSAASATQPRGTASSSGASARSRTSAAAAPAPCSSRSTGTSATARALPSAEPIPGLTAVFDDWFSHAGEFNAHLSVRGTRRELLYKPNNKVATAEACNAVLLTSRDEAAREHLGDDYPFYTDPDRDAVIAAIAMLERRIGGSEWRWALE